MNHLTKILIAGTVVVLGPMLMMRLGTPGHVSPSQQMHRVADCANQHELPHDICSIPELMKLHTEITAAYEEARQSFRAAAQSTAYLEETHQRYLDRRSEIPLFVNTISELETPGPGAGAPDQELSLGLIVRQQEAIHQITDAAFTPERRMRAYLAFLRSLDGPRMGIQGRWVSLDGEIRISDSNGRIVINEAGPDLKRCAIDTRTTIVDGLAQIDDAEPSFWSGMFPAGNKTLGGWSLRARRNGAMLVVSERTDKDKSPTDEQLRPYCGGSAPLEGRYFPAR